MTYIHNSIQKDFIRDKWIEFAKENHDPEDHDFSILTFPAEDMQDLHLFKKHGFIDWEETETEFKPGAPNYKITKGKVKCFEKSGAIYKKIRQRLIQASVENTDFCGYIVDQYLKIMGGSNKTFPLDVINLDFEERLYNNNRPFDNTIKYIFEFQKKYKRNFSLFVTWPIVEESDIQEYKQLLDDVITSNLADPLATEFKKTFEAEIGSVDKLDYERKSAIGVTKVIIKKASQHLYKLIKTEFYVYGGEGRQRMISLLFNFKYDGKTGHEHIFYSKDVINSMEPVQDVNHIKKKRAS